MQDTRISYALSKKQPHSKDRRGREQFFSTTKFFNFFVIMFHKYGEYVHVVQDFSSKGFLRNSNQQNLHFITQETASYAPQFYVTRTLPPLFT
jgi:hypothetical protein